MASDTTDKRKESAEKATILHKKPGGFVNRTSESPQTVVEKSTEKFIPFEIPPYSAPVASKSLQSDILYTRVIES